MINTGQHLIFKFRRADCWLLMWLQKFCVLSLMLYFIGNVLLIKTLSWHCVCAFGPIEGVPCDVYWEYLSFGMKNENKYKPAPTRWCSFIILHHLASTINVTERIACLGLHHIPLINQALILPPPSPATKAGSLAIDGVVGGKSFRIITSRVFFGE